MAYIPGIGRLPPNCLIGNPAGSFHFVGSVDGRLGYTRRDGSEPTEQELHNAAQFGPRLAGLVTRTFPTREAGFAAARALGLVATI